MINISGPINFYTTKTTSKLVPIKEEIILLPEYALNLLVHHHSWQQDRKLVKALFVYKNISELNLSEQ